MLALASGADAEALARDYIFQMWMARCLVMNGKARQVRPLPFGICPLFGPSTLIGTSFTLPKKRRERPARLLLSNLNSGRCAPLSRRCLAPSHSAHN